MEIKVSRSIPAHVPSTYAAACATNIPLHIYFCKNINSYINNIIKDKKIVLALGASTKGNILLQHFGLGKDKIPFISERNSSKVGLRCLGTDIELISEEKARSMKPKAMLVLPWYFKEEIIKREKKYIEEGGELIFPMPYPYVVTKKAEVKL